MKRVLILIALSNLCSPAWADDAALKKCRLVDDPAARLKCYDAIPLATAAAPTAAPSAAPIAATAPAPRAASAAAPAAPAAPVASAAPAVAAAAQEFGLQPKAPEVVLDRIDSRIEGRFEGWRGNSMIRFANGQVWQVTDDSSKFLDLDNPKVSVRRGALGAFYLEIDGTNASPRVRRVR